MADRFIWGAATSAHQVEGNNIHNDWWEWEKNKRVSTSSGVACDHYHRFRDDFALAKNLGHNAHRLSLEWSRIELECGQYHSPAIAHYREVLQELRRLGFTTFVTLHHFTNPLWFSRRGGWENPQSVVWFTQYVQHVVEELGDLVDYWLTINEPTIYALKGYWEGTWPPGKKRAWSAMERVLRHLAAAHHQAYRHIHRMLPLARVGLAHSVTYYAPAGTAVVQRALCTLYDWWYNHRFLQLTRGSHDFLGLNYYFSVTKRLQLRRPFVVDVPESGARSDLHWPIQPEGVAHLLRRLTRYQLPIYITENGLANADDTQRADFIRGHLRAIEDAQATGTPVRGYLHWSLLDNFEWADGFSPRFGLVAIDYTTQQRTPRPSAYVYKAMIEQANDIK